VASNTYIIKNGKRAIIIDAGARLDNVLSALKKDEILEAVLLTHGHFDHCFFAAEFQENGAKICINRNDAPMLESAEKNLSHYFGRATGFRPLKADIFPQDGDCLNFAGLKIKVLNTPGHSLGGVCYVIDNTIFTGDTLFFESYGRTDLGDEVSFSDLKASILGKIFSLNGDYTVFPGHGQSTTLDYERENNPINYD